MCPHSEGLRERAVQCAEAGEPILSIASAFHISPSCVSKWCERQRETEALTPGQMGGHKPRTPSGACADWLRARIATGHFTTRSLTAELAARGIKTDRRAAWFCLRAEGISFRKIVLPAEQSRRNMAFKRAIWKAHQDKLDPGRLIFIDETCSKTKMAPLRGWGLRGQRLDARVPHGHWKTLTFIAALRHDRIEALSGLPAGL
jgi:transposase